MGNSHGAKKRRDGKLHRVCASQTMMEPSIQDYFQLNYIPHYYFSDDCVYFSYLPCAPVVRLHRLGVAETAGHMRLVILATRFSRACL